MQATIHKSKIGAHIVVLELDHPPANTLSKEMKRQFMSQLEEIENTPTIRAVIITGRGDKFCVGDDLKDALTSSISTDTILRNLQAFSAVIDRVEALPIPTIAAINGWCIGGGLELALCCDIRIAIPSVKFISAGVNVGLTASAYRLPRLIGTGRAKRLLLTGEAIDVEQALQFGLVTDLVDAENLLPAAIRIAQTIASKAPLAVMATKKIANVSFDMAEQEGFAFQQKILEQLAASADYQEALSAFSEKRKPFFKGE